MTMALLDDCECRVDRECFGNRDGTLMAELVDGQTAMKK
jgi:hypothetical protein